MAKQTTEAIITLNGKQPIEVLNQIHSAAEKIKQAMEDVQQKMNGMSPKDDAYKNLSATFKTLKGQYDLLASAQVKDIEATQRLQSAVDNLASTSLKNLRKALGDGKKQIEGLSSAELEQANSIRELMKSVGDQIRLLEGKYVKIREGLASIGTQSDQWLSKAISQQQELLASTRRGTKEYKDQEQVMQMLTAEQNRRNASIAAEATARKQAQFKQQVASSRQMLSSGNLGNYSSSEIQTSINTLKQAQSQAAMGGSEWKQLADEIKKAEAELDKLAGKTKEVKQQMSEGEAKGILGDIGSHTEQEVREAINALKLLQSTVNVGGTQWNAYAADIEKAEAELGKLTGKIKEAKAGLSMNDVNSRMQTLSDQSEQSLKEMIDSLQKAKAELTPYSQEWSDVAAKLMEVKNRMADVAANAPYVRNEAAAQSIARNDQMQFQDGTTHDVTRQDLQWSKDFLQKQLDVTPVADTAKIKEIQEALGLIDERMKALNGDTEKATMSADKLDDVLNNMKSASLSELRDASAELKKQIDGLAPSSDDAKKIKKQLQDLDREIKQVEDDIVDVNDVIARSKNGKASISELKQAYKQLEAELEKVETGTKEFAEKHKDLENLRKKIDEVTVSAKKQGGAWNTALKNLTAYVGLFQVFNKVKDLITGAIRKNLEYSGSLTDIRKVSGLTMEEVNKLSTELAKIDTRTSVEGLAQLAYQGAKLGMGKFGVDGMKQFVAAADQINVAIGEEMGEEALPALSKMVETMGLIPKMGIEKAMLATGSAMFKLSSTSTATSGNIVEFAKRLTGVSRTAGITTDQLLALGSASDSLFLMPEVSATAMSKFIVALQKNHNLIEKDLGIQQGTIKNMYAAGNAMDAIVLVLEKMRDKGNMNALGSIFKDLGSDGQRLVTAMVTMSKNVDVLKDHLYESQEAFEEATAVTSEYEMQQQSAIGILERANNLWEKAFVNPEGVDMVKNMAQAWYDMSELMTQSPIFKGTLSAALSLVIASVKTLVVLLPALINYIVALGVWKTITFLVTMAKSIWAAVTAQNALNAACKVNPYVALASVIMTAIGIIAGFANKANEAAKAQEEAARKANAWKDKLKDAEQQTDNMTRKLHSYKVALEQVNLSQKDRNTQIARFNRDFRQYISKLGIEIKSVSDLRKHYSALANEIQRATYYRLREEAKQDALPEFQKDRLNAADLLKKYISENDYKYGGFSVKDIIRWFAKGADANAAYKYMIQGSLKNTYVGPRKVNPNEIKFNYSTGEYTYDHKGPYGPSRDRDKELLDRLHYLYNATQRESNKEKEIDEYFSPFVPKDYTPWVDDEPGTLENDAPDKDAIRQQKQEERDRRKAWRDELKQKQDEANAIMDDVRNFYERQINQKMEDAIALGMDKTEQDLFVEPVRKRMNEALEQVRLAIAGQKNTWNQFKQTMDKDLVEKTDATGVNLSQGLLKNIQGNNVDALRKLMAQLSKNLGIPMTSTTAQIFAKASKNEQNNISLSAKQQEARRKVAQEHDYTGVVKQNMYDDFNTMGYANPNEAEVADKAAFDKRKANIIAMYEKARMDISKVYKANVSTEEGRGVLMSILFGDDPDGMAARIKETLGDETSDWQAFYLKLLQYSDEYTEAMKKQYDDQKKIVNQMWDTNKRNLANQEKLRRMQNESNFFGKRTNLLSNLGLANLTADPEIELMKARMQAAEDYYAFVKANTQNMQLIREADTARQQAELNYANQMATAMKSRLSQMKELVQPIEDFGSAVGQALATMKDDADSANEAIKSALKSMLESWGKMALNDVNTQMWKAINDAGAKRAKAKAQPDIDAARNNAKANAVKENLSDIGTAGNPAHVIVDNGISVDSNGNPVTPNANGSANTEGTQQTSTQPTEPPAAWQKRNPGKTMDDYNREVQGIAGQTGSVVADVATGNSSIADAGADIAMSGVNAALNADLGGGKKNKKEEKERKKALKEEKKHQKELSKETKKGTEEREKTTDKGAKKMAAATEEGNKEQSKGTELAQKTMGTAIETGMTQTYELRRANDKEELQAEADTTQTQMTFSIAGAIGKCFQYLGPIAGPIAAAVVMSTLTGLMQWALSSAFKSKSNSSSSSKNTKLVSGMLTYDSGNVQDLKPFVGDNGEVYWATEQDKPQSGVNLLTTPTATTINGQRSLVAENGPELVIGRETTKAMMMNNPSLLKALVNYDSNYSGRNAARRTFDEGNIGESVGNSASGASATDDLITNNTASNAALLQAVNALLQRLNEPISAKIDMYGRGNLYDSMTKANQFMKGKV